MSNPYNVSKQLSLSLTQAHMHTYTHTPDKYYPPAYSSGSDLYDLLSLLYKNTGYTHDSNTKETTQNIYSSTLTNTTGTA